VDTPATQVISWVNENLPPLSWRIISMENMKVMSKNNIYPSKIDDATKFNEEIVTSINSSISIKPSNPRSSRVSQIISETRIDL
jgi:hypothetical protein